MSFAKDSHLQAPGLELVVEDLEVRGGARAHATLYLLPPPLLRLRLLALRLLLKKQ